MKAIQTRLAKLESFHGNKQNVFVWLNEGLTKDDTHSERFGPDSTPPDSNVLFVSWRSTVE